MQSPTLSTTPTHMVREAAIPALSLNGRLAAKVIRQQIKERIAVLAGEGQQSGNGACGGGDGGRVPGLGIVMANGWVGGWVGGLVVAGVRGLVGRWVPGWASEWVPGVVVCMGLKWVLERLIPAQKASSGC